MKSKGILVESTKGARSQHYRRVIGLCDKIKYDKRRYIAIFRAPVPPELRLSGIVVQKAAEMLLDMDPIYAKMNVSYSLIHELPRNFA